MQIQTNSLGMKRNEYFRILARNYFQKRMWFYFFVYGLLIFIFATNAILKIQIKMSYIIFAIMALMMPFYYLFWFWRYSGNSENAIFYRERVFTMTEEFLEAVSEDRSTEKLRWENILCYKKIKEGYLLYISKQQFVYLPRRIFRNDNDFREFETFIFTKLKKSK